MLFNFLALIKPINSVITISNSKVFKNKNLIVSKKEIEFLESILEILEVFVVATTKLQAEKYPTIYYLVPLIYKIYIRLDKLLKKYRVSLSYSLSLYITNFYIGSKNLYRSY